MAGTRDLAAVVDQAAAVGAKVVLVGDHHQLPEVAAGGAFRAALDTLGDRVVELTVNRRQHHAWEQAALDELRCGDVPTAFAAYRDHGRVVITDNPDDLHAIVLADWHDHAAPSGSTLLLAGTRAEARLLNRHARADARRHRRARPRRRDHLRRPGLRRRRPGRDVPQPPRTSTSPTASRSPSTTACAASSPRCRPTHMTVRITSGEDVVLDRALPRPRLGRSRLRRHDPQGPRRHLRLRVRRRPRRPVPRRRLRRSVPRPLQRLALRHQRPSRRTSTKATATASRCPPKPNPTPKPSSSPDSTSPPPRTSSPSTTPTPHDVAELVATTPPSELLRRARHARRRRTHLRRRQPGRQRAPARRRRSPTRTHVDVGRRVRAIDRDNVGHVVAIDDTAGTCTVHFESSDGRTADQDARLGPARRHRPPRPRRRSHPPPPRRSPDRGARRRGRRTAMGDGARRARRRTRRRRPATGEPSTPPSTTPPTASRPTHPTWLTTWLGQRPTTPAAAAVWDDATTRIAHHRLLHDVADDEPGIGPAPTIPSTRAAGRTLMLRLLEDRLWLADHPAPDDRSRSPR